MISPLTSTREEFERITEGLADALDFSRTIGAGDGMPFEKGGPKGVHGEVDFYTSHEGLMLDYEEALTRTFALPSALQQHQISNVPLIPGLQGEQISSLDGGSSRLQNSSATADQARTKQGFTGFYNTSAHFLWIGDRTRQLDGAHIEYFRGIRNPIGAKVGPSMRADELLKLVEILNPDREPGRLTLITRYGAGKIEEHLPGHIAAVQQSGVPVIWVCDPMHGKWVLRSQPISLYTQKHIDSTLTSASGLKTRNFSTIVSEVTSCLRIHSECNSKLNGVSLEFTGELSDDGFSVTECLGGSMELSEDELELRYQSFCDPRLNFEQSLDLAFLLSNHFKKERRGHSKADRHANLEAAFSSRR
ncbi:hypothetical protein FRC20_010501 [Serendipita sp. 405]|nr:hypothetical protein FRC20_010501 [Serendipita sp. 405]